MSEMIKRGWINADDIRNVSQVEVALTKFFGVDSVSQYRDPATCSKENTHL